MTERRLLVFAGLLGLLLVGCALYGTKQASPHREMLEIPPIRNELSAAPLLNHPDSLGFDTDLKERPGPSLNKTANQPASAAAHPSVSGTPTAAAVTYHTPVYYQDKAIFLIYHHIDAKEGPITISPERFASHMQMLQEKHYNVISIEQYLAFIRGKGTIPPNAVVLTFDDGYESYYTYAFPVLKKYGYPSTQFLILSMIGYKQPLPYLTWEEIADMKAAGYSFYSHTYDMHREAPNAAGKWLPILANPMYLNDQKRQETPDEYRTRIKNDLALAERTLSEKLGNTEHILCYPYGAYNKTVTEVGQEVGIQYFVTIKEGINSKATIGKQEIYRTNAGTQNASAAGLFQRMSRYNEKK